MKAKFIQEILNEILSMRNDEVDFYLDKYMASKDDYHNNPEIAKKQHGLYKIVQRFKKNDYYDIKITDNWDNYHVNSFAEKLVDQDFRVETINYPNSKYVGFRIFKNNDDDAFKLFDILQEVGINNLKDYRIEPENYMDN